MAHEIITQSGYRLSDDPTLFDLTRAYRWISSESYWGSGIPQARFDKAVANSVVAGVYAPEGPMVAMARVVTDRATFAWICDVFVENARRGAGLGKALMDYLRAHPDLQGLRRTHLATRDAHELYRQFGFGPLTGVDRWMEIRPANPYG